MPSETDDEKYSIFGDDELIENEADDERENRRSDSGSRGDGSGSDDRRDSLGRSGEDGCPKCGDTETETDEIATSGTGLTKMFDVQNRSFVVVSCTNCGYSELYKGQSSGDAIDFFLG